MYGIATSTLYDVFTACGDVTSLDYLVAALMVVPGEDFQVYRSFSVVFGRNSSSVCRNPAA